MLLLFNLIIHRADFLVASDLALRAQLTEFRDHHLVSFLSQIVQTNFYLELSPKVLSKRGSVDGGEYLTIPLDRFANINHTVLFFISFPFFRPTLQAFLENIEESWDGALLNKDILDDVRRVKAGPFSIERADLSLTINFLILFCKLNSPIAGGIFKDPFHLRSIESGLSNPLFRSIYSKPFWKVIKLANSLLHSSARNDPC